MAQTVKLKNRSGTSQTYSGISTLTVKNSNNQNVSFTLEDDLFSALETGVYGSIAGTIWQWNTAINFDGLEQGDTFSVRWQVGGSYSYGYYIKTDKANNEIIYNIDGTEIVVYTGGTWASSDYMTLSFQDSPQGADATNARFIGWLEANAQEILGG